MSVPTLWDGYKAKGTKKKNGREVPNCVKEEEITEKKKGLWDNIHAKRKRGEKPAKLVTRTILRLSM